MPRSKAQVMPSFGEHQGAVRRPAIRKRGRKRIPGLLLPFSAPLSNLARQAFPLVVQSASHYARAQVPRISAALTTPQALDNDRSSRLREFSGSGSIRRSLGHLREAQPRGIATRKTQRSCVAGADNRLPQAMAKGVFLECTARAQKSFLNTANATYMVCARRTHLD